MNAKVLIRHLSVVLLSMSLVEAVLSAPDWFDLTIHRAARSKRADRHNYRGKVNVKQSCCQNGGMCIMGSFCHCMGDFYGRYCEKELLYRSCGTLPHGTWIKAGCNACQCYDGQMVCSPNRYSGCETAQWKTGLKENATYTEGEAVDPELPDDNYEYYYVYEEDTNGARMSHKHCFWTVLIFSTVYMVFMDS